MIITKSVFPTLSVRRVSFAGFFTVELSSTELEQKGKQAMSESWETVSHQVSPPPDPASRDSDGDWSISWEDGLTHCTLDLQSQVVGAAFARWPQPKTAEDIAMSHAITTFRNLEIRKLSTMFIRYNHVFVLPQDLKNHEQILSRLVGTGDPASPLHDLLDNRKNLGRFDIALTYHINDTHYAFVKVELPSNRSKRTVWFELGIRTLDDKIVSMADSESNEAGAVHDLLTAARHFYSNDYASLVSSTLADFDVALLDKSDD